MPDKDTIKVKFLRQKVYHDGTSMCVKKKGESGEIDRRLVDTFLIEGAIEKPKGWKNKAEETEAVAVADGAPLSQLDHDSDGKPGGSTSGGSGDDMKALRAEYAAKLGKNPFPAWDADELKRRIAQHDAQHAPKQTEPESLDGKTIEELRAIAEVEGVTVSENDEVEHLVELIIAKRAESVEPVADGQQGGGEDAAPPAA